MFAVLERVVNNSPTVRTFWFRAEKPLHFVAGQFTELHLPHPHADDRGDKRWFTISSSPTEALFSITTRFAAHSSTFKQKLASLPLGSRVHVAEPMGDFVLPKDRHLPLIFVAAGIGITPVRSIIKYLSDKGERRTVTLLYTVHRQADLVFVDELRSYPGIALTPLISRENTWRDTGRLSTERILHSVGSNTDSLIYLSGPEAMGETMNDELKKSGISGGRLIVDFFHGYRDI